MRKNNKRILSFGLVLCMLISLFSTVAYAEEFSAFVPGQYETKLGEDVEIQLKATDTSGVIAMLCEIEFDNEILEVLRYDDAKLIKGTLTTKTDESPMRLFWMDALATENTLVEGVLGTFTFKALQTGKAEIKINCIEAYNKDGDLVLFDGAVIEVDVKDTDVPVVELKEYTINATAGENGKITPSGEVKAIEGKQLLFMFTPDSGYNVDDVKVDGVSIGAVLEYTFDSVNADGTIEVNFKALPSTQEPADEPEENLEDKPGTSGGSSSDGSSSDSSSSSGSSSGGSSSDSSSSGGSSSGGSSSGSSSSGGSSSGGSSSGSSSSGGSSSGSSSSGGSSSNKKNEKENEEPEVEEPETKEPEEVPEVKEWVNPFSDVNENDWYYEYVKYINDKKLMNGVSETEFAPNDTVTRAMFVTVLYRLEKEPAAEKADFADVAEDAYYGNAVGWAVKNGIVNGVSETKFAPNNTITREQMATIIHRYMKFKGLDMSASETDISSYEDFEKISPYAQDAFRYACSKGIISGTSETTLAPDASATRAQMAAIFQRCEKVLLNQ